MEILTLTPDTAPSFLLPMEETILCPLGDIQYGAPGCEVERLERHIDWAEGLRAQGKQVYYIGMGDYVDVASPSNRGKLRSVRGDLYDSVNNMMEEAAQRNLEQVQELLAPTKGYWFGLLSGHHYWEFPDGTNTDSRLAQFLETNYLGTCAYLHLRYGNTSNGRARTVCKIWAHHGEGGGQTVSSAINKLMQRVVPYWEANLYLMGHYHTKDAKPIPWVYSNTGHDGEAVLRGTTRYMVITGGFLSGYTTGSKGTAGLPESTYVEKKLLAPQTLGAPVIFIRPHRMGENNNFVSIDINVSI